MKWLNRITKVNPVDLASLLKVIEKIAIVYNTRGKHECIRYTKDLRLRYLNHLFKGETGPKPGLGSFLPRILKPLKQNAAKGLDYPLIRLTLSALYSTRLLRLKPTPSFETIERTPSFTRASSFNLVKESMDFLRILRIDSRQLGRVPRGLHFKEFHMTSKSGPNGHALWTSYLDLVCLPPSLKTSIEFIGGKKLSELMPKFSYLYQRIPQFFHQYTPSNRNAMIRKLAVIADKEGKTREVAILDYWSQAALKPLHDKLYQMLSTIEQDCTHNQSKHIGKLTPAKGSSFHSIDLTAATDLFPIVIEWTLLRVWFGKEYADHWKNIMVGYPFEFQGRSISYNTGNPMGAYSSWATFALAHHFIVYLACKQAGVDWKQCPYMLLGDDIVIAHDAVAEKYKDLLSEIGVPFSLAKTHVSKHGYEFAKRIVTQETDLSPFPIAALYERRNSPIESVGIIVQELSNKSWTSDVLSPIKDYFLILKGWNRPRVRSFFPKVKLVVSLLLYLQGKSDLGTPLIEYVAETTGYKEPWPERVMNNYATKVAGIVVTKLFESARDRVTSKTNKLPLGELATRMVMEITSLRDGGADCFDLIESVPFLQIYGRAEEKYLYLSRPSIGARLELDGTKMRDIVGKVDIPLSDTDFYVRHRDVIVVQALRAAKVIDEIIQHHKSVGYDMIQVMNDHRPFLRRS